VIKQKMRPVSGVTAPLTIKDDRVFLKHSENFFIFRNLDQNASKFNELNKSSRLHKRTINYILIINIYIFFSKTSSQIFMLI